ncbi:hypothetical protein DEJ32_14840 [Curtobacterium sp. MCPF17_046]|nr:hypothetical protein DEJ32_14840 [Curtobacterium sp. MCPF17_046]
MVSAARLNERSAVGDVGRDGLWLRGQGPPAMDVPTALERRPVALVDPSGARGARLRSVLRDALEQLRTERRICEFEIVPDVRDHARREALGGEWQQFGHGGSSLRITPDTSRSDGFRAPIESKPGE